MLQVWWSDAGPNVFTLQMNMLYNNYQKKMLLISVSGKFENSFYCSKIFMLKMCNFSNLKILLFFLVYNFLLKIFIMLVNHYLQARLSYGNICDFACSHTFGFLSHFKIQYICACLWHKLTSDKVSNLRRFLLVWSFISKTCLELWVSTIGRLWFICKWLGLLCIVFFFER